MRPADSVWARLAFVIGGVGIGFSQIFLNLIVDNPDHFWPSGIFQSLVLFWTFILPAGVCLGIDLLLSRRRSRFPLRLWRVAFFSGALFSFLCQIQAAYPRAFASWLGRASPLALGLGILALLGATAWRWPDAARRYLTALSFLAFISLSRYVVITGVWGPSWTAHATPADSRPTEPTQPIFLLIFDELSMDILEESPGQIDGRTFPSFARLASQSGWFSNATTNHAWTTDSIPTMLSGKIKPSGTTSLFDYLPKKLDIVLFDNIGEARKVLRKDLDRVAFRDTLRASSDHLFLSIRVLLLGLLQSPLFNTPLDNLHPRDLPPLGAWGGGILHPNDGPPEFANLLQYLKGHDPRGKVIYWHGAIPHAPFLFSADGTPHGRPENSFQPKHRPHPHPPAAVLANYREQVRYVDRLLGSFLDELETRKLDEGLLVVTSDHGLRTWFGYLEPPEFPAVRTSRTPRIPLFIRAPTVVPGCRSTEYQHVDLAPTLLELMGVAFPSGIFDGRSVFENGPPRPKIFLDENRRPCVFDPDTRLWTRCPPGIQPAF